MALDGAYGPLETPNVLSAVRPGVVRGREPLEGYKRGFGLQFGDLADAIEREPLFREADAAPLIRPIAARTKLQNLYLLVTRYLPQLEAQDVIEFGAYQGGTALFLAVILRRVAPGAKVYALDTFGGMPPTDPKRDAHVAGQFSDAMVGELHRERDRLGLENLITISGLFQETFPTLPGPFALAHIDCDIYSAVSYAQNAVWPKMVRGGYVAYDDADVSSCLGATEAVEDLIQTGKHAEQVFPHFVFRAGL